MRVGARELKNRLGSWLARVRAGEVVIVTERGVPVAELRAITGGGSAVERALQSMAAEGLLTFGDGGALAPPSRVPLAGGPLADDLLDDRGDRL